MAHALDMPGEMIGAAASGSLVDEASRGDRTAFARLTERYREEIFRMVYYRVRSFSDAEDITQDVFLQAYRRLPRLREKERFRPWLCSIALNRVRDFQRRLKFRRLFRSLERPPDSLETSEGIPSPDDPSETVARQEFWEVVHRYLDNLSKGEREVFLLRFFDQLTLREAAGVLGRSESTVKTQLHRALSKCRKDASLLRLLEE